MSTRRWVSSERLDLVDHLATLPAAETQQFFGAHGLGIAYSGAGQFAGKKSKINAALIAAERRGDISEILDLARVRFQQPSGKDDSEPERKHVSDGKVFISHASHDNDLASLLKDTLVLGGVPQERVFYSSERGTGIPAGVGVRQHLQETLRESAIVIELLSETFLARPYCLMELGGAWVMDKVTFPIVVPPLTRDEAVRKIGDIQMAIAGDDHDIDDLMAELQDGIREHAHISLRATDWANAIRGFKSKMPTTLSVIGVAEAPSGATIADKSDSNLDDVDSIESQGIRIMNFSVIDGRFSTEVHGEAINGTRAMRTASIRATFYNSSGKIIGTAMGLASEMNPDEKKTFTVSSTEPIRDYARFSMQIDNIL